MQLDIIGTTDNIETIAVGNAIRDIDSASGQYAAGRWRKLKGTALVRLPTGQVRRTEVHWYEVQGIGRRKLKVKYFLD